MTSKKHSKKERMDTTRNYKLKQYGALLCAHCKIDRPHAIIGSNCPSCGSEQTIFVVKKPEERRTFQQDNRQHGPI